MTMPVLVWGLVLVALVVSHWARRKRDEALRQLELRKELERAMAREGLVMLPGGILIPTRPHPLEKRGNVIPLRRVR